MFVFVGATSAQNIGCYCWFETNNQYNHIHRAGDTHKSDGLCSDGVDSIASYGVCLHSQCICFNPHTDYWACVTTTDVWPSRNLFLCGGRCVAGPLGTSLVPVVAQYLALLFGTVMFQGKPHVTTCGVFITSSQLASPGAANVVYS